MAKKLWVKMFGGFSAGYGDEVLTFGRNGDSKFRQLFQILLTRPGQGFDKRNISESLYERNEVEDINASLNNTIFRLRKYLESSPLPPADYLLLSDGMLYFTDKKVEIESEVWDFECIFREFEEEQDKEKKADLCKRACELYQGEFLPWLSNEQWVIEKSQSYQKMYFGMLEYLLHYLKENGDYKGIEGISAKAAELCPYEGWENWYIESLIASGRYKEAEEAYRKMARDVQENGGFISKKQQTQFREIGGRIRQPEGTEEDIRKCLTEFVTERGAYACTLPGFVDYFRILKRVTARGGNSFSLILCTLLDAGGHSANNREYCEKHGKELCASFQTQLRKGDVYAKYSENQYLLLCIGAKKENFIEIGARINKDFRKRCGGRGGVSCRVLEERDRSPF